MSGSKKAGGFEPTGPPDPARLTVDEIQRVGDLFLQWFERTGLKWWIVAAGVGAVIEAIHVFWLAYVWMHGRL
jgi:hypothetical protein